MRIEPFWAASSRRVFSDSCGFPDRLSWGSHLHTVLEYSSPVNLKRTPRFPADRGLVESKQPSADQGFFQHLCSDDSWLSVPNNGHVHRFKVGHTAIGSHSSLDISNWQSQLLDPSAWNSQETDEPGVNQKVKRLVAALLGNNQWNDGLPVLVDVAHHHHRTPATRTQNAAG